jgi:hypothetical protein
MEAIHANKDRKHAYKLRLYGCSLPGLTPQPEQRASSIEQGAWREKSSRK